MARALNFAGMLDTIAALPKSTLLRGTARAAARSQGFQIQATLHFLKAS
jgi:hypothetical protein